jgi:hypothetical protein
VESKSNALESAIWRLTAGKGDGAVGPLLRSGGSGEVPSGAKAGEPVSERKTAAGRMDFVLQVSCFVTLSMSLRHRDLDCAHCLPAIITAPEINASCC